MEHDGQSYPAGWFRTVKSLLGSSGDCDLLLVFPSVSRQHARLSLAEGQLRLEDLGSSNGTRHNGLQLTRPVRVQADDLLQFGDVTLRVEAVAARGTIGSVPDSSRLIPSHSPSKPL